MRRLIQPVLALLVLASLGLASAASAAPAAKPPPPGERDRVWAQSYVDLPTDPAVRFGTLPNGFRYAIMKNATPSKQASIRMRVGVGSLNETDAQQGLAHFLEHMAFNGSKNVPAGEMIRILERHGLAFGADTNASTSWTETVYQLDLPQTDDETIDTALMLMREAAGELTIDQKIVDTERGVVLSEERARDNPGYRVFKNRLSFLLKDQLAARRLPIGTVEVLTKGSARDIRDYYEANYRPERTALILVGDFDPDAVEAKIKARFADWKALAPARPDPNLGKPAARKTEAKVMVEAGGPTSITVSWVQPPDTEPDSEAHRRRDIVEQLGFAVINRRLERLARSDQPPFIGAGAGADDYFRSARVVSLTINADPDRWREGLIAAEESRRKALEFGVRQDELDREITELRAAYQTAADSAATRRTPRLASELAQSLDDALVFTSPQEDLALFERAVKDLKAAEVDQAMKRAFTGEGPLVFMSNPKAVQGGDAALLSAFQQAESSKLAPPAVQEAKSWPYESFGPPGTVAERKDVLDLDATFVRFANGVRLTVKPTKFRKEQVLMQVRVGKGRLELPTDRQQPGWAAGFAFVQGGLKQITLEDMEQVLASKVFNADFAIGDDAFVLSGSTRPQDFDTQLQVLTAFVAEPGWRPEGFLRMRTLGTNLLRQMEATPQGILRRDLGGLMHGGDARWTFPTQAQIEGAKADDIRAMLEGPLTRGEIEVVIVGDVSVERAIDAVGATLGALPARPAAQVPVNDQIRLPGPTATPLVRTHSGRPDQAVAYVVWPTKDFFADPQEQRALRIAQLVLERRLVDQIRIAQGSTYSPSADWDASLVFPGYGYISADVEIPPAKIEGFYNDVSKIIADLREKDVTPDELERARKPRIEAIEKAQQTNEYWLGQLGGADRDPRRLDSIRSAIAGLQRVTAADVRKAAQAYLKDERAWKLIVRSKDAK